MGSLYRSAHEHVLVFKSGKARHTNNVQLGRYAVHNRGLVIDERDGEIAKLIFRLYLELGNVSLLETELDRRDIRTRVRTGSADRQTGGQPIHKSMLYKMLSNPIYIGRIRHKDQTYKGNHEAMIDSRTWEAVQAQLANNTQGQRKRRMRGVHEVGMLAGLLFDDQGNRFVLNHANKQGRRYRYYVESRPQENGEDSSSKPRRIPAKELDRVVRDAIFDLIDDPMQLIEILGLSTSSDTALAMHGAERLKQALDQHFSATWQEAILPTLRQIMLNSANLTLQFDRNALQAQLGLPPSSGNREQSDVAEFRLPVQIRNRGAQLKLILDGCAKNREPEFDRTLIKAIARAHDWFERLETGQSESINAIAKAEGVSRSYVTRIIRLAFLSPAIVEEILSGSPTIDININQETPIIWHA